jgi:hypothetical protein
MTIKHREAAFTVFGTGAGYDLTTRAINPGLNTLFPWGSQLASAYERYRIVRMNFEYVPSCPTTTAGSITFALDYDTLDEAPSSGDALRSYFGAVTFPAWKTANLTVDPGFANRGTQLFVRTTNVNTTTRDLKTYDVGQIHCLTEGFTAFAAVGRVFANYEIELLIPQITSDASGQLDTPPIDDTLTQGVPMSQPPATNKIPIVLNLLQDVATFTQRFEGVIAAVHRAATAYPNRTVTFNNTIPGYPVETASLGSYTGTAAGIFNRTEFWKIKAKPGDFFSVNAIAGVATGVTTGLLLTSGTYRDIVPFI